jgi:hypothetical protein
MTGMNLFETFEEEHMEYPSRPRYNTRSSSLQHSATKAQFLAPRILRPIAFTNNQCADVPPTKATTRITMANAVINKETGASMDYRHLIQDEDNFPVWNKAAANESGLLAQGVGERFEGSSNIFF